ncbi:MAG TPA: GNAT family N-acetyltransferase, partial [Kofleriaceae bacterium]|nr:GNAT family N-acetyltransferase [Kofleriaceae bacterium]
GHDVAKLIVIAGDADAVAVAELARAHPEHALLTERLELAGGRRAERAILHTLADPDSLPDIEGAIPLARDVSLAHLPPALADELGRATSTIWAAWVDGEPVSFAFAPWRSDAWFDVSVDTLAPARQLGLATIVATAMIRDERAHGREPVWGADEANTASRALARRLGFTPVDEIWVAPPVG